MIPKYAIAVTGNLHCTYHFDSTFAKEKWKRDKLPALEKKHGKIQISEYSLPPLNIGDLCHVLGEGTEIFQITEIFKYEENRYGYILNDGEEVESVHKCYPTNGISFASSIEEVLKPLTIEDAQKLLKVRGDDSKIIITKDTISILKELVPCCKTTLVTEEIKL